MMRKNNFAVVSLASNGEKAIIAKDCIAFAIRMPADEEGKNAFTRVIFKQLVLDDESKWIDIQEEPEAIL